MGVGKTYVAGVVIRAFDLPTLVVGPKISRTAWTNALHTLGTGASFCNYELLRTGKQPYGTWDSFKAASEYFKCTVCQCRISYDSFVPCYAHPRGIHCLETKRANARYGQFVFNAGVRFLVFDEGHRGNGIDSLNAELLVAAKRQGIKTLVLSATPAHSPLHFRALGYLLDLHNDKEDELIPVKFGHIRGKPSFGRWAGKYKCRHDVRFRGLKWFAGKEEQKQIMLDIRSQIIPSRGVRVTTDSIPGFPTCDISTELYDLENPVQIDRAYREMAEELAALDNKAAGDKCPDNPLTISLRAQQKVELLKVPVMAELAEDYDAKGVSIVFFVNFSQTIEALFKRFPDAGIVDGSPARMKSRDKTISRFQHNELRRLIVNNRAGSVSMSLHDLEGGHPRGGLVSSGFSAVDLEQIFGRLPRDGGRSHSFYRVLFAAGSIEVKIWRAVKAKLDAGEALTDADLMPDNLKISRT